ncbi:uncharacterized protein TRIADDRAFT_28293 [Trichoplax adhaerens]|uniref:Major facilitator superfamily associated domain-containing protein n=1 Tax=Trichoplax adhaerens TaxID=10228 RepID=B3S2U0_TRIAD|nr:hypothetical protein TRIADDRAFT_28293 [Trichoplax adhaerens]EDV22679.1 hypothetical protein TRIADDRAFT_28293 [Trichoplax adhaerens]|eukprot:XP_002114545.1 hypothetical protein TRIADDRAFT_28293 [Trichoplax adhaerens]
MSGNHHNSTAVRLAYGSIAFFLTALHNIFIIYYVDLFITVYKIDQVSFWIGETIFLIWNSLNDPLFGWISDRKSLSSSSNGANEGASPEIVLKRVRTIRIYGPLFAISFMSLWIRWAWPGLQFILCLCLYDGFLTIIDLNFNALLADLAVSVSGRSYLNSYCSVFSGLGTTTVFLSYAVWNRTDLVKFQIFCGVLTIVSAFGFFISATILSSEYRKMNKLNIQSVEPPTTAMGEGISRDTSRSQNVGVRLFLSQVLINKNFLSFSVMNLLQVFHCHFNSNFFPLFLHYLLGDYVSPITASILLGVSFVVPHFSNIYLLSLCRRYGVYNIVQSLFYTKLIIGLIMLTFGSHWPRLLCLFIVSNRIFTEGICKLLNLAISDLIDEDYVQFNRKEPISALMFGVAAFISKPGQTIAPLVGSWMIESVTGKSLFKTDFGEIKISNDNEMKIVDFRQGCFNVLVGISIGCAIAQIVTWSFYELRDQKLKDVKQARRKIELGEEQQKIYPAAYSTVDETRQQMYNYDIKNV